MTSTTIDLNKIMARVQALLAKADSSEFPAEATTYRAKAEEMMREYRIQEEQLIASDQVSILPEVHRFWLGPSHADGKRTYFQEWYSLAYDAGIHAGCMVSYKWGKDPETGQYGLFAVLVGYSGDLRLAEMVYSAARIVFGERLEPKPDPALSDQANAYRLRSAGINRDRAAEMLWGSTSHARAARIGALYKAECAERGETPALDGRGIQANLYRGEFASAFVETFRRRLREARDAADHNGGALTLAGRQDRIREAFWTEFPELRPKPADEVAKQERSPKTRKGRDPKPYWETAAYRREQERRWSSTGIAAREAGSTAARSVDLDRPSPAKRVDEAPRRPSGAIEG